MGSPGLPQEPRLSAAGAPEPDLRTGGEGGLPAALGTWHRLPPREAALPQGRSSSVERVACGAHQGQVLGQRALPGRDRRGRACRDQCGRRSRCEGELRSKHGAANPCSSSRRPQSAQTSFPSTKSRPTPFTGAPRAGDKCVGGPAPGCDLRSIQCQSLCFFFFLLIFWQCCAACGILVPQPGMEPMPPAVEAQSRSCWTPRRDPQERPPGRASAFESPCCEVQQKAQEEEMESICGRDFVSERLETAEIWQSMGGSWLQGPTPLHYSRAQRRREGVRAKE